MKWSDLRRSSNVEDHRGGGIGGGGLGIGGVIVALLVSWIFGINPLTVLSIMEGGQQQMTRQQSPQRPPTNDQQSQFVSAILGDLEDVWRKLEPRTFRAPKLVLFDGRVRSACGMASSAVGPFYCPADQKIYLDLDFFHKLSHKYNASGDFAQAYVIAHEMGHHLQTLQGISSRVHQAKQGVSKTQANALSVRQELQADCYAGLWGYYAQQRNLLDFGDREEALKAASEIGDDKLQMRSQGYVVPESFTHGSAQQRMQWFETGFKSGRISACDTFR